MKKILLILISSSFSFYANAQLDFFFNTLDKIGTKLEMGDGYINTIQDVRQVEEAIQIINDSKCILEELGVSASTYRNQYGLDCFTESEIKLLRVKLDKSTLTLMDQLASNGIQVGQILGGLFSKDDKAAKEIERQVVTNAINDAIDAMIEMAKKQLELEQRLKAIYIAKKQLEQSAPSFIHVVIPEEPPYTQRTAVFREFESVGKQAFKNVSKITSPLFAVLVVLNLFLLSYTLMARPQGAIINITNATIALIVLTIAWGFLN